MATAKKSDTKKKPAVAKNLRAAASVKVETEKPKLIAIRLVGAGSFASGGDFFPQGRSQGSGQRYSGPLAQNRPVR